jgi:Brp/Blh family beta-carotene 15,15'-monooxygenase
VSEVAELVLLGLAVFVLGTPHGALDGRLARDWLRPTLGERWFLSFIAAYLALAGLTLALWLTAPVLALAAFLALAALHFGEHDAPSARALAVSVRGALPPVIAAAAHPGEITAIFATLAGEGSAPLAALLGGPIFWLWVGGAGTVLLLEPAPRARAELLGLAALFALAPPLVAFSLYFGLVHSPRALLASRRPGERWSAMARDAFPWSLAAVLLALPLWAMFAPRVGEGEALVRTIFWWLSALTVPHMALHLMTGRRHSTAAERSWPGSRSPAAAG